MHGIVGPGRAAARGPATKSKGASFRSASTGPILPVSLASGSLAFSHGKGFREKAWPGSASARAAKTCAKYCRVSRSGSPRPHKSRAYIFTSYRARPIIARRSSKMKALAIVAVSILCSLLLVGGSHYRRTVHYDDQLVVKW